MKPTIGRIVHYYPWEDNPIGLPKPAIITAVHSDTCVNLEVFGIADDGRFRSSVLMLPEDALGVPRAGYWNWPPRV